MRRGLQRQDHGNALRIGWAAALSLVLSVGLTGCGDTSDADTVIAGAGASAPARVYQNWGADFDRTHPRSVVAYDALGSSRGTELFFNDVVSFASTELPLPPADKARANGRDFLQVPITVGAIVLAFNLGPVTDIDLSQEVVAGIYLGEITSWSDPRIAALNPGASLPDIPIVPVHRVDGSGSTYAFTRYLTTNNQAWRERVGSGGTVDWPTSTGALGSRGTLQTIRYTPGAIGYLSFGSVMSKGVGVGIANIENTAGAHIRPSVESIKAALRSVEGELLAEINAEGKDSYPIILVNYALVWQAYRDAVVADGLKNFFMYGLAQTETSEEAFGYSQLPEPARSKAKEAIESIRGPASEGGS